MDQNIDATNALTSVGQTDNMPDMQGQDAASSATPFTDIQPEQHEQSPFVSPPAEAPVPTPSRNSDTQNGITAALGGLAQQKLGLMGDSPDDRLQSLTDINKELLDDGQEKALRAGIAQQTQNDKVNGINKLQSDLLSVNGHDMGDTRLSDLMHLGITQQQKPLDPDSLEEQGVSQLQGMAARDPDQAALMANLSKQGDVLDRVKDNVTKLALFNRETDAFAQTVKNQPWYAKVGNVAEDFLTAGVQGLLSRTGNIKDAGTEWSDLPATRENKEIGKFWNLPLDEFKQQLPQLMGKLTSNTNASEALGVAKEFGQGGLNNSDALSYNLWTGANLLGLLPLGAMARVPSKMARMVGNRVASADIVSSGIGRELAGVPDATMSSLQPGAATIEESLPSSLVPSTANLVRPDVGVVSDVANKINQIKQATDAATKAVQRTQRLAPEQVKQAIEDAVKEANVTYSSGENIVDMKQALNDRPQLVAARQMADGRVHEGVQGGNHFDLLTQEELDNPDLITDKTDDSMGFTQPGSGKFLTRDEAGEVAGHKGPLSSEDLNEADAARSTVGKVPVTRTELFDPDADLDNLSYFNARGEVYQPPAPAKDFEEIGGIKKWDPVSQSPDTGIYSLNFYLGKKSANGGFLTKEGAEAAATRKGFDLKDVGIHQNSDGQFFVKVRQPIAETGVVNPVLKGADFQGVYSWGQYVKSADNIMPEIFNRSRITATIAKQKSLASVVQPWVNNIRTLNRKSIRAVSKVLTMGERDQKWYNLAELDDKVQHAAGRLPTEKERLAYYSSKELNDINHNIMNNNLRADKERRGLMTVRAKNDATQFDTGYMNGREVTKPDLEKLRVYDLESGATSTGPSVDLQAKLDSGRYRVIELEKPHVPEPGEDPINYILGSREDTTVGPLHPEQLGYVEGGSRENRSKWFVKQANKGTFKDGTTYWMNPHTHVAARTGKEARQWAEAMEESRLAYNSTELDELAKRRIIDRSPVESYDKFDQLVKSGSINKDMPFEALFDRQQPTAMSHIGDKDVRWVDTSQSAEEAYHITKGRMYYSKKGEHLTDPSGDYAEILDPFTTLHNAISNAQQTSAFADYNRQVMDEWSRFATSNGYIDPRSIGNNVDPYNVFFNGKLNDDLLRQNPTLYNQLEMTRNTHKRLLNLRTNEQSMTYTMSRRLADWAEGRGAWGDKLSAWALDRSSSNPINAVRGMVFDAHLGWFDPGQLLIQSTTAFQAMTANPIYGARTAAMTLPLSHVLMNRSENLLDFYAKALSPIHGLATDDWKDMVRSLRNSGWMNVGGEMVQLDQYTNRIGGSMLHKGFNNLRVGGRYFFNMAEKFNRVTAYQMAWQLQRAKFPEMAARSSEFIERVNKSADDLSMNMTTSSGAYWQKGALSIPSQFLAYQTRVLENILPKAVGGTTRFSAAQKTRMALGQLLMYGSAGIPGATELLNFAGDEYSKANGKPLDPDTWRNLSKGFFDSALFGVSGGDLDTDFARRAGQGAAWTDFYRKITDGSMNSVLQVAGGASGAFIGNMSEVAKRLYTYMRAEQVSNLDTQTWALMAGDLTQQISSLSRAQKAYWIWKTGLIKDPKTGEAVAPATNLEGVAEALGVQTNDETMRWDLIRNAKDRNDTIREMSSLIALNRRNAQQAWEDGDETKRIYYENMASGLLMPYRDDPMMQQEIAKETEKQLGYSNTEIEQLIQKSYDSVGRMPNGAK